MLAFLLSVMMATSSPSILSVPLEWLVPKVEASEKVWTVEEMKSLAIKEAKAHHLNTKRFLAVINCESGWSATSTGAFGELGIAHIYPKYHPELTKEEMLDPTFSISWMASQWDLGHHEWWTCWRMLEYTKWNAD